MNEFKLFAEPWWVNFLIFIPFIIFFAWKKRGLNISKKILIVAGLFGVAFGFVEASVVIYLRAAVGLLPDFGGTLSDIASFSSDIYKQAEILVQLPVGLAAVEFLREAATIIMLAAVAFLAVSARRERFAMFLWVFAIWDIFYYVGLWALVRWPTSLISPDVLFLIPIPWLSQVWFPLLVSVLTGLSILASRKNF